MTHVKERKVRYLCPVCFKDSGIKMIKQPEYKDFETNNDIKDFKVDMYVDFMGICKYCDYEVTFIDIDEGMVDIIQYLNNNHYNTKFCCEGHMSDINNYDYPYLVFSCDWDDKTYMDILNKLPESWEMYLKDTREGYGFFREFSLYCRNPIKYENYLEDLKELIYNNFPKII